MSKILTQPCETTSRHPAYGSSRETRHQGWAEAQCNSISQESMRPADKNLKDSKRKHLNMVQG